MLSLLSLSVPEDVQGTPTPTQAASAAQLSTTVPDWPGRSVAVIGSGRPAQTMVRNLERLTAPQGARPLNVHWLIDGREPVWQNEFEEILPTQSDLAEDSRRFLAGASHRVLCWTEARVTAIEPTPNQRMLVRVSQPGDAWAVEVDRVLSLG